MTTTTDHLETIGAHLCVILRGDLPPSFRAPEVPAVLAALGHLTAPGDVRNAASLGLLVAQLLVAHMQQAMEAERAAALALQANRLQ